MMRFSIRGAISLILLPVLLGCLARDDSPQSKTRSAEQVVVSPVSAVKARDGKAPNFAWKDASGKTVGFDKFHKKVTVLNFWATWCAPCRKEIPDLIAIHNEMAEKGVQVIGVSVDRGGDVLEKVRKFTTDYKITYPIVIDNGELQQIYGSIRAIPTTFIINSEGKVVEMIVGLRTKEAFLEKIKQHL